MGGDGIRHNEEAWKQMDGNGRASAYPKDRVRTGEQVRIQRSTD